MRMICSDNCHRPIGYENGKRDAENYYRVTIEWCKTASHGDPEDGPTYYRYSGHVYHLCENCYFDDEINLSKLKD